MAKKKIKKVNVTTVPFGLAGMTAGFGIAERAFPGVGFAEAGRASSGFIAPAINIGMGGYLVNQIRGFGKK